MANEHKDQIRIVQETVAGKEITFAHVMGGPDPIIYQKLGFHLDHETIGYWYIDRKMKRYHRYSFTKGKLINDGFDKNKTEREIMRNIGYYRIYDSGQKRWKYDA